MQVQKIKATKPISSKTAEADPNLRVCAYARVSTDSEEQETSYEAQCSHYTDHINANPNWTFAGIYSDEGITGTSTKKRDGFNKMIDDCRAGKIDLIITKSISRWARNTLDSIKYIRELKDINVAVYFEKENINTLDARGEVLITILSSLAQQESESISKNVKMGIRFKMQNGKGHLSSKIFLGYEWKESSLFIDPGEADTVRRIFREYLEGYSAHIIAVHLTRDGIPSPAGKETWYQSTVESILQNEKYCGQLLLQKYYVSDFLTHKTVKNEGQLPQYFVDDNHSPIVPKDIFYQVQYEMQRRRSLANEPIKVRFGSENALKGRVICGVCGKVMKRYKSDSGSEWYCKDRSYVRRGEHRKIRTKCGGRHADDSDVRDAVVKALNSIPEMRNQLIRMQVEVRHGDIKRIDDYVDQLKVQQRRLEERLEAVKDNEENADEISFLRAEIENNEADYVAQVLERAAKSSQEVQIRILLELIDIMEGSTTTEAKDNGFDGSCADCDDFFKRTCYRPTDGLIKDRAITCFSDELVVRYLDHVTILPDGYEVALKAGVTINI